MRKQHGIHITSEFIMGYVEITTRRIFAIQHNKSSLHIASISNTYAKNVHILIFKTSNIG